MKMLSLAFFIILSASAYATQITCNETHAQTSKYYERFVFTLDEQNRLTEVADLNWNAKTNSLAGYGTGNINFETPLYGLIDDDTIKFNYVVEDIGDGDYGSVTNVQVTLPKSLAGHGQVIMTIEEGNKGTDAFQIECN